MPQETQHTEQIPATKALPFFARYLERVITGPPAAMQATPSSQAGGQCLSVKTRVKAGASPGGLSQSAIGGAKSAKSWISNVMTYSPQRSRKSTFATESSRRRAIMKVKTRLKAGGIQMQHNETLVKGTPRKRACA